MGSIFFLAGFLLVLGFGGFTIDTIDTKTNGKLTDRLMKWLKIEP